MDRVLIAGQTHDQAEAWEFLDELRPVAIQPGYAAPAIRGKQLSLGDPELPRRVTDAKFGLLLEQRFPAPFEGFHCFDFHSMRP